MPANSETPSEVQRLRRGINDLVAVLAVPFMWSGGGASLIAATLLDVLVRLLRLDFAYVRVSDSTEGSPHEWARFSDGMDQSIPAHEVGEALRPFLADKAKTVGLRVATPLAEGTVSIGVFPLGLSEGLGQCVVCSVRTDFPTDIEALVLQVATNQAAMALQEVGNIGRQRRSAEEPERRVVERTQELTAANEALQREAMERARSEEALAETEDRLRRMADCIPEVIWINPHNS